MISTDVNLLCGDRSPWFWVGGEQKHWNLWEDEEPIALYKILPTTITTPTLLVECVWGTWLLFGSHIMYVSVISLQEEDFGPNIWGKSVRLLGTNWEHNK